METATIRPGALSFILRMSRCTGTTPLSFKVLPNGYRILSVSRLQQAYCVFILNVFNILGFIEMYFKYKTITQRPSQPQPNAATLLDVAESSICVLATTVGYVGYYRMKNMIHHLNILEKARHNLNYDCKTVKHDKNVMWISSLIIISYTSLIVSDNILSVLRASVYGTSEIVSAVHYFVYGVMFILKIQFVVLNFEVYEVLRELNEKLRFLLALADRGNVSINIKTRKINNEIRSLTRCYISICEVTRKINKADGLYLSLIYICFTLFGVFNGYRLILALNRSTHLSYRRTEIFLRCCWCITVVVRTSFFVEPFERISLQVSETMMLLTKLTLQMTPLGSQVSAELDIMIKQVILNVPQYSLLGMQKLNRSLLTTTFSGIITYLVFILQLESKK